MTCVANSRQAPSTTSEPTASFGVIALGVVSSLAASTGVMNDSGQLGPNAKAEATVIPNASRKI